MARRKSLMLTEPEREIMEIVWDHQEISVFEVREILSKQRERSRTGIRTTMERMQKKGWLTHRVIGRTFFYSALIPREVSLGRRVVELIDKACGGEPELLMNALLEYRGLTAAEIKRIQTMLKEAKIKKSGSKGTKQ